MPPPDAIKSVDKESALVRQRVRLAAAAVLAIALAILARVFYLQVIQHERFTTLAQSNRIKILPVPPARGLIFSNDGVLLAGNRPAFTLEIVPERVEELDALLWEYPPDRFLPHTRLTAGEAAPTAPIVVAAEADEPVHREVLVNLAADIPDFLAGFERVAEVVLAGERAAGRAKYRRYRERGYPLFHHELDDWE